MGFDPGRAELLGALTVGGLIAAAVALALDRQRLAFFIGALAVVLDDFEAFRRDTLNVMEGGPAAGGFSVVGWIETGLAIIVAAIVVAWAAMTLARPVRAWAVRSVAALEETRRSRRASRSLVAPAGGLAALLVFLTLGPVLGSLLNYGTDSAMHAGGAQEIGIFGGGASPTPMLVDSPTNSPAPTPTASPADSPDLGSAPPSAPSPAPEPSRTGAPLVTGPAPDSLVSPGVLAESAPWETLAPNGKGTRFTKYMPKYWIGGGDNAIDVYLPPGYDSDTTRRYPVVYEMPYNTNMWDAGMGLSWALDYLITSGQLPPMIVIFVWGDSAPYRDTECSNSLDGREWFDDYLVQVVVPSVDVWYRTIPTPEARTTLGSSKGGYCAASALTHHPSVFASAISFSGYYTAGAASPQTAGADLVFGQDRDYERSQSPILRLSEIPSEQRRRMFVVQCANPKEDFYGPQMRDFSAALLAANVPQAVLNSKLGHSWEAQRQLVPTALRLIAARQVRLGVFPVANHP
ncbi:MAG TPA: alpha/beta hydrolase-fold protein [Candidatus Limnocylindrales bacterium]|nr:alpha/beta hydrolase-fold protein [Candidatus Limnocylindrales bacterium]